MSIFTKIKNRTRWILSFPKDWIARIFYPLPQIATIDETLDKIIQNNCSVARYGDGEFNLIFGKDIDFQKFNQQIKEKMITVLEVDAENFLVGIPDSIETEKGITRESVVFWRRYKRKHRIDLSKLLNKDRRYYNACITRFYLRYKEKSLCNEYVSKWRKIWDNRDIVFIEGEKSRLGVGNDFFDNTKSIKRILCPANQAFDYYDEIIESIEKNVDKDTLVLIALGPTATAMAYDIYLKGYQAIDIGHIDIEYEWMRMGAKMKVAVTGKYTNEVEEGKQVEDNSSQDYVEQIIARVGI